MNPLGRLAFVLFAFGAAMLAGCAGGPAKGSVQDMAAAQGVANYHLGAGDSIKVTVFGEADLSGTFVLDGQGAITMPLIGAVQIADLTLDDAAHKLEGRLRDGWLKDPKVTTEMIKGRPYYILGEVNKPGEYPYVSGLTVMRAIASAGDFTYRAEKNKVVIKSADSPNEREVELTPTTTVRPGDTIRVLERFFF